MKCYITAGHQIINGVGNGAKGIKEEATGKVFDEAVEARKFVNDLIAHQKRWYKLDTRTDSDSSSLREVIAQQVNIVDESWLCIDAHFNAGPAVAGGVENYISKFYTEAELTLARQLALANATALGLKLRSGLLKVPGVKMEHESQHPRLGILSSPHKATNILLELCFITNKAEVASYRKNYWTLVKEMSDVIGNWRLRHKC